MSLLFVFQPSSQITTAPTPRTTARTQRYERRLAVTSRFSLFRERFSKTVSSSGSGGGRGSRAVQRRGSSSSSRRAPPPHYRRACGGSAGGGGGGRRKRRRTGGTDRSASGLAASSSGSDPSLQSAAATNREASPPAERPVERKSYSLARRTRSRPADLGSKQASVEESVAGGNTSSPSNVGGKSWSGGGDAPSQAGGGVTELDQDVARLNLARQSWSPTSYMRSEMRGLPNPLHMPGAPPQFSSIEEMGVGNNRAKRYSSQRQRAVPEPAPPMHLGVMEGHYYEPSKPQIT
uniref:Uncharacterized protein n=1 Tax=Neolamprologus brichardi TaxID=32507 RepID=A0A3Q4HXD4_NEOBR